MSLRLFLITMLLGTLLAWVSFVLVLLKVDPGAGGLLRIFVFYVSFAASVTGTAGLIGFIIRHRSQRDPATSRVVVISFRQGLLVAFLLCTLLILQSEPLRILRWWNASMLLIIFSAIEGYYLYAGTTRKTSN